MPDYLVINCAVGGSSITTWQKGQIQYENCLTKVLNIQEDGYVIEGIFFYQGERDSGNYDVARLWKLYFYRFVNNFRVDIGIQAPIVFAQLGVKPLQDGRLYWSTIKNLQRLSESEDKEIHMIYTGDIKPYCPVSAVHFCPDGYVEIANRFTNRFEEVVQ